MCSSEEKIFQLQNQVTDLQNQLNAERKGREFDHQTIKAMFSDLVKARKYLSGSENNYLHCQ